MSAPPSRTRRAGFTLIEVIGAFFMMTIILIFVTGIFVENGRQRAAASELMRVHTTAAAALDLIAQDLEGTLFLTRPPGRDPRDHPWVFLADRTGALGATALRFPTQNVPRGNLGEHASTWVEVAYFLTEDEADEDVAGERYTLWRWRSNRPPSDPNPAPPDPDDPRSARVVEGVADFGVTFVDAEGALVDDWDSTFAPPETPVPIAAEIQLSLYRAARAGETEGDEIEVPSEPFVRHVTLPMHVPIDVSALVSLAQSGAEGPDCATVDDCLALGDDAWFIAQLDADCDGDEELCSALEASSTTCWDDVRRDWPSVAAQANAGCETLP